MTDAKRLAPILAVLLFSLAAGGRAQTVPVEVTDESARFSAAGQVRMMQVEVYGPGGEMVFVSGFVEGGAVEWSQRDQAGRRVADGVYTAAVTTVDASGELRKRVERVVVGSDPQAAGSANAPNPTPQAPAALTGEGTAGKIAKFTSAYQLGNSVITESAGKINVGANLAPAATLQVNGAQPAADPADGTDAAPLLETKGGKGGNTTTAGQVAGKGASIFLRGGNGGNAVSNSMNGSGGSITLQGGSAGTGGTGGTPGHVLLAPTAGNVGIGTSAPTSKLTVAGSASQYLVSVTNNIGQAGLFAKGSTSGVRGEGSTYGAWGVGGAVGVHGDGTNAGVSGTGGTVGVSGQGETYGVYGLSVSGNGVYGKSFNGYAGKFDGVVGVTSTVEIGGTAFFGSKTRQMILLYNNTYAIGVQNSTHYFRTNGGFAWYRGGQHSDTANSPGTSGTRLMKLDSAGNLTATSFMQTSDRNAKSNFSAVNPRAILDRLNSLPIQTWSYKAGGDAARHIGPVAQDFKAAFNLGADDKTISTVDSAGVTMAAVQGLYRMMLEKERRNEELARRVGQLQARVARLERAAKRGKRRGR